MVKEKQAEYGVWAKCYRQVIVNVTAKSLEEALEKSKGLEGDDFVTVNGEYDDGSTEITGVLKNS